MKIPLPPSSHLTDFKDLSRYKQKWECMSSLDRRKEEWQISVNTQYERDLRELSTDDSQPITISKCVIGPEGCLH